MKRLLQQVLPWMLWALALVPGAPAASELATLLKGGNHVLLMRHALAPGVGDPNGFVLERCATQRLLNDSGKRQAQALGQWLRAQGIAQARVYTSAWCRSRQTAELLALGPVTIEPSLASFFNDPRLAPGQTRSLQAFIARALRAPADPPLVLVTHHVNIRAYMGQDIGSGDMVLARVDAHGRMLDYQLYPSP